MSTAFRRARRGITLSLGSVALALSSGSVLAQDAAIGAQPGAEAPANWNAPSHLYLGRIAGLLEADEVDTTIEQEELQIRHQGNVQNALATIPGVLTRQSPNQPGIEVNIRGMSGYGRVNSMIDGVPQNFRNIAGHEASGGNLLYVHPELLAGVDVTRGAVPGAKGSGTLTGAANFRTLIIDDVLKDGEQRGVLARLKFGNNGSNMSGMLSFGQRFDGLWGGGGRVDLLLGYAYTDNGNYRTGAGEDLPDGVHGRASTNSPKGAIAKIDIVPNDQHKLSFGLRTYDNAFQNSSYSWDVRNKTWTADYVYTPGSDWVNLKLSAYYNDTKLLYPDGSGGYVGRNTQEETYGVSLVNRADVPLAAGPTLGIEYGLSWNRDDFQTHSMRGGNHPGKLDKASAFADAELDFGRLTLSGGLRYDYWRINGYRPPYSAGVADCPADGPACGDTWESNDGGRWLPRVGAAYQVTPEVTLRASYAHTFRPPTTHEAFFSLVPFGDGVGTGMTNNLDLKPELSRTVELGANFERENLWRQGDQARLTVSLFQSRIKNFIVNDFVSIPGDSFARAQWVNRDGTTTMRGIEVEGGYDAGNFYVNLGLALSDTDDQPLGDGAGAGNGEASALPKRTATLDVGTRLLDEKLTLGAQIRYVGKTGQVAYDWSNYPSGSYWSETDPYTLVDLYGSYALTDEAQAYFSVENVFDKAYGYPGGSFGGYQAQTGRGRTFIAGVSMRF